MARSFLSTVSGMSKARSIIPQSLPYRVTFDRLLIQHAFARSLDKTALRCECARLREKPFRIHTSHGGVVAFPILIFASRVNRTTFHLFAPVRPMPSLRLRPYALRSHALQRFVSFSEYRFRNIDRSVLPWLALQKIAFSAEKSPPRASISGQIG
jgi:hypothetical protein